MPLLSRKTATNPLLADKPLANKERWSQVLLAQGFQHGLAAEGETASRKNQTTRTEGGGKLVSKVSYYCGDLSMTCKSQECPQFTCDEQQIF